MQGKKEDNSPEFMIFPLVQPGPDSYDIEQIKRLTRCGLENSPPEDRAIAWLVFFEIYPKNPNEWYQQRQKYLEMYELYKETFELQDFHTKSFPQYIKKDVFNLKNNDLMMLIHGDVVRTGNHIFKLPEWMIEGVEYEEKNGNDLNILRWEGHMRRLERILYIIGSLNSAISYMQGFNELIMPIYYTLYQAQSLFSNNIDEVERLTFFCLHQLLSITGITDLFTTQDKSSILIYRLNGFLDVLKRHVPVCYDVIQKHKIHPVCYCFRWFSLLFCQDYQIPKLLLIWDALLTHIDDLINYSFYIGAAQIKLIEDNISEDDYPRTIDSLQNLPAIEISDLIRITDDWWNMDHDDSFNGKIQQTLESAKNMFSIGSKYIYNFLK